jgi:hypothetical protein
MRGTKGTFGAGNDANHCKNHCSPETTKNERCTSDPRQAAAGRATNNT